MDAEPDAAEHTPGPRTPRAPVRAESARTATHLVELLGVRSRVRVAGTAEERIAAIAARQRGYLSRRQLRDAGVGRDAVRRRVARGSLIPVHPQVLAVGHLAPTPLRAETAALLAVGRGALVSHLSAAAIWGLLGPGRGAPVHLLVLGGPPARLRGVVAHRARRLGPRDARIRDGLPLTSPARTLLDLADIVAECTLERALNEAHVLRVIRADELADVVARAHGRRGAALLRELAEGAGASGPTRSEAERRLRALIRSAELPEPNGNVRLHGYELDCYWPQAGFVVEVDGFDVHSARQAFERDRIRDARLAAAHLEVMRVTWRQMEREPLALIARIAQALARRTSEVEEHS